MARTKTRSKSSSSKPDFVARAVAYAEAAIADPARNGRYLRLAAQRFLDDLARAAAPNGPFRFDPEQACRACRFIERLPHVEGTWETINIQLHESDVFLLVNLFGFRGVDGARRFTIALKCVARKSAKALALDTPIPTPSGWTTMGELQAGDQVIGADGMISRVLWASPVYHDHPCYRLVFSNGQEVVADAGHLWRTRAQADQPGGHRVGNRATRTRVRTTEEIARTVLTAGRRRDCNHSLDMPGPFRGTHERLPVPPYTFGAWLGDGHSASARITFMPTDLELASGIRSEGVPLRNLGYRRGLASTFALSTGDRTQAVRNTGLAAKLRRMGVLNNKHIPPIYLRANKSQRLALLQGLMDTDGTICKSGRLMSFTNTNERLARGVAELLATFGIKYSIKSSLMRCNGKIVSGLAWKVQFMAFRDRLPVFRLTRKLARMRELGTRKPPRSRSVQIVSATPAPSQPVRCIGVDSPDHQFLFGTTMLPTHNSTISAAIGLYCQTCEPELGPCVLSAATTGSQARVIFNIAKRMVQRTPALRQAFKVEAFANAIASYRNGGTFKPINAKASTQDGLNPSAVLLDEIHAHQTSDLLNVLRSAAGARRAPLFLYTTTEGYENHGPWGELRTFAQQVLEGLVQADHFLALYYALDDEDEDYDEAVWIKANPLIEVNPIILREMRKEAIEAKAMPSRAAEFRIKRLNRRAASARAWVDLDRWRRCAGEVDLAKMEGKPCWAAFDLASTRDMNAWRLLWIVDGICYTWGRYWTPADSIHQRTVRGTIPYEGWVRSGFIQQTDGDVTDYAVIERDIVADCARFKPQQIGYDDWNASDLSNRLVEAGLPLVKFIQGPRSYNPAMNAFERAYINGTLRHGGNPVLTWNAANLIARTDANNNKAPDKKRSTEKIDGVVALLMCFGLAGTAAEQQEKAYDLMFV